MTGLLADAAGIFGTQADKYHCSCCQHSGWECECDTETVLPSQGCCRAVLLPFESGMVSRAAVQKATCVRCYKFQQSNTSRSDAVGTRCPAGARGFCMLSAALLTVK